MVGEAEKKQKDPHSHIQREKRIEREEHEHLEKEKEQRWVRKIEERKEGVFYLLSASLPIDWRVFQKWFKVKSTEGEFQHILGKSRESVQDLLNSYYQALGHISFYEYYKPWGQSY